MNDWTVMIYMGGDNSLSDECVWALKDICRVGLNDKIDVIVQFDSAATGVPIKRYDIRKILKDPKSPSRSKSTRGSLSMDVDGLLHDRADVVSLMRHGKATGKKKRLTNEDVQEESLTDPDVFFDFIDYCVRHHKARHYLLIFSGHGSGADEDVFMKDDNPAGFISVRRLRYMLEEAEKQTGAFIDILGLDSCAMSTVEVAYELRGVASYLVAAEGLEPGTGWPHYRVIEALKKRPAIKPKELAQQIVRRYVDYYSDYTVAGLSVDLAACDLSKIEAVEKAVTNLSRRLLKDMKSDPDSGVLAENLALEDALTENAVILAHWRAQSYRFEDYVDLIDFCELLKTSLKEDSIKETCKAVIDAISDCVVECCYSGSMFQHSRGLSIYFPWTGEIPLRYRGLSFSSGKKRLPSKEKLYRRDEGCEEQKNSKGRVWLQFLERYIRGTERSSRNDDNQSKDAIQGISSGAQMLLEVRLNDPINRLNDPLNKGLFGRVPRVKNPPTGFYKDRCGKSDRK